MENPEASHALMHPSLQLGVGAGKELALQWQGLSPRQILQSELWGNAAVGDTLWVLLSQLLWASGGAQNTRGVWEGSDSSGIQIKALLLQGLTQCGCQHLLLYLMHPHGSWQWKAGTVQQHRRWQKCRVSTGSLISAVQSANTDSDTSCLLLSWSHTQQKAVTALVTKAAPTELLPAGPGNTAETKFITATPEINLASETMASCN